MKRKIVLIGTLAFTFLRSHAQVKDSTFKRKEIKKTEIELLYNHYTQDGNNSAVTGGSGTEKLVVYAPAIKLNHRSFRNTISLNAGADIISSASTDNIDFIVSSASRRDARTYANIGFGRDVMKQRANVHIGTGFSIESDYFSVPLSIGGNLSTKNKMRTYFFDIQMYFDDLRWGRLNEDLYKPTRLVYPAELRYKEWYNTYKRQSYNFKLGIQQIINKRNILGIYPEITYQEGLLATPFHRIYYNDGSIGVEKFPDQRLKTILGLRLNSFVRKRIILKNRIDLYADNFGMKGIAFENETAFKLNPLLVISPSLRLSMQQASTYFKAYMQHKPEEEFVTSDYDLSSMQTMQLGMGMRYISGKNLNKHLVFNEITFHYLYYVRSNQLNAHIISIVLKGARIKMKEKSKNK